MLAKSANADSMKNTLLILPLAILALNSSSFAADTDAQWKVEVAGLRVIAPVAGGSKDERGAFFSPAGVSVAVKVTPLNVQIVSVDQNESIVDSFKDDKGTDLLATKSEDPFNKPGLGMVDAKVTNATFEVQAAALPAKGATKLNISGKLSAKVAGSTKQFTIDNVAIQAKTSFNCGDLKLTISAAGAGKSMWGDKDQFTVNFTSATDVDSISTLEFFDAQGNKIDAHKSSWGGGMGEYFVEYTFKKSIDHAKIVATCWQDMKTVEIPISLKTGLGL